MCALLLAGRLAVNHVLAFFFFSILHPGAATLISLKQNKRPINGENPEGRYFPVDLMSRHTQWLLQGPFKTVIQCIF